MNNFVGMNPNSLFTAQGAAHSSAGAVGGGSLGSLGALAGAGLLGRGAPGAASKAHAHHPHMQHRTAATPGISSSGASGIPVRATVRPSSGDRRSRGANSLTTTGLGFSGGMMPKRTGGQFHKTHTFGFDRKPTNGKTILIFVY